MAALANAVWKNKTAAKLAAINGLILFKMALFYFKKIQRRLGPKS